MKNITPETVANLQFELQWNSPMALHIESYAALGANTWRDCLPDALLSALEGKTSGENVTIDFNPGMIIPPYAPKKTFLIKKAQFDGQHGLDKPMEPRMGRFYPKGILKGIAGVFPQNLLPFRCVGIENQSLLVDFNHPLAKKAFQLQASVKEIGSKPIERGGRCNNWVEMIADGPGMQSRWENTPTDFFSDDPFKREDQTPDTIFYTQPRLVQHIDDTAVQVVKDIYGRLLQKGMRVLDLMSSWQSHIPAVLNLGKLTGLGLNQTELEKNKDLSDRIVHDLNANPILPFKSEEYDAVICAVSVEYLIHPTAVFAELGRILRPDGLLIVTFSNRWFPAKVIRIWEELHEFERMGLVLEYFEQTGKFSNLTTYSARGLPRPWDDKYFPKMRFSDPIFAVWGTRI